MFLNTEYEYPKINESLRKLHKKKWLNYYKCLQETYADIGYEKVAYPSVLLTLEGTSVTLKCQICISPAEIHAVNLIEWYFNSSNRNSFFKSMEDMNYINSPNNQYIIIYNLKLEQAGVYWCKMGDVMGSVYYLHIDDNFKEINAYPDTTTYPSQVVSAENVSKYNLKVYTTWTTWSSCSTCNAIGIKLRYGYCTISFLESLMYRHIVNANISTKDELQEKQYMKNKDNKYEWNQMDKNARKTKTINENIQIQLEVTLWLFNNKLPCKTNFLPKEIQMIQTIKEKKTEIMRRYCKKRCRKNMIFEVRDERNNVLESVNNSAGIYSMIQGIPKTLSVMHSVVYEKHNKKIRLVCPGNLNANVPIVWQINDKIIIPSHIKHQSNGRIHFNPQMHIIFESLKFEDANIYSCWQNNEIAGIIKLNVAEEIEFKLNHHIILTGAIFILGVFLLTFWRVFKRRMQYTIH